MYGPMPTLDLDHLRTILNPEDFKLVEGTIAKTGKNAGQLRASKPPVDHDDPDSGRMAYVWRMLVFYLSRHPKHHHLPMTADFDLPISGEDWRERAAQRKAETERLDKVVDQVVDSKPPTQWYGAIRWHKALYG